MSKIIIKNLTKIFDRGQKSQEILFDDINVEIDTLGLTFISGVSGIGKTTLFRMIAGLDNDYEGKIDTNNLVLSYMFQENRLLNWMNVIENINFVLPEKTDENQKEIELLLTELELYQHKNKYPKELSGGMKRRVALIRTLVFPGQFLLLDEPFNGLDENLKIKAMKLFYDDLRHKKRGALLTTHDAKVIEYFKSISKNEKNIVNMGIIEI